MDPIVAPLILGGAVALASSLYRGPAQVEDIRETDNDMYARGMLDTPEEFLFKQSKLYGIWAPQYQHAAARVPWDTRNPPYTVARYGATTDEGVPSDVYQAYVNAKGHQRKDAMEQIASTRQAIARSSGQPIWTGFTAEISNPADRRQRTQHMQWSWLPRAPADSDFADAAALAKAVPPNPNLFTPDAWFATAPGLPFRYSY